MMRTGDDANWGHFQETVPNRHTVANGVQDIPA